MRLSPKVVFVAPSLHELGGKRRGAAPHGPTPTPVFPRAVFRPNVFRDEPGANRRPAPLLSLRTFLSQTFFEPSTSRPCPPGSPDPFPVLVFSTTRLEALPPATPIP